MTRTSFDYGLQLLHDDLVKMGSIVEKQIHGSVESLVNQDVELAEKIIKGDDLVDDLQREIEDKCIKLIGREQPLAKDLRNIFTTTKIVTDLERMADHAVDIAKITRRLKDEKYIKKLIDIPKIATVVQEMIKLSIDAYIEGDSDRAYEICKMDDEVDAIYKKIFTELLAYMDDHHETVAQASQLLFVCKYLERIADHVTNICEWTIYLVTGNFVDLNE
ncbi:MULTISPECIES: phosphate signaling complex protein PhoU [Clostridium]|jgi:phosphate transport system protein|uniref:Phosphate-specific transport system accessory protein PhoU n=1 Tax=Clostridium manihotivorum TaxID=2320868 RepID=A0A3R5X3N9_9CLOT|nr:MULTISPECIES: phosphate signaling complex protein PhoU [Clostridium]QAA33719.1 phosphate transport system regulatory protein PhoU [Clostridium manihotivorum]